MRTSIEGIPTREVDGLIYEAVTKHLSKGDAWEFDVFLSRHNAKKNNEIEPEREVFEEETPKKVRSLERKRKNKVRFPESDDSLCKTLSFKINKKEARLNRECKREVKEKKSRHIQEREKEDKKRKQSFEKLLQVVEKEIEKDEARKQQTENDRRLMQAFLDEDD